MALPEYEYFRPKLAKYQTDIIDCEKRFTITEASTKSGKTVSHIVWLFEQAIGKDVKVGNEYWWVAPVFSQAQIAFERMQRFVNQKQGDKNHYNFFIANKSQLSLTLPNGAVMRFKSADNPDSLYGEDVYACVFDEFTRAKYQAWIAIRSTLTATRGKCKFIGNYKGDFNWGHILSEKAKEPNSEYQYFKITAFQAVDAGILDAAEIEQARIDLTTEQFNMLYMAEGTDSDKMLFNADAIKALFNNTHIVRDLERRYITADIALEGSDKFVIGVWFGWVLVKIYVIDKSNAKQVVDKLIEVKNNHGVPNHHILYDADGVGGLLGGHIEGAIPFHNNGSPIATKEKVFINGEWKNDKEDYAKLKDQCYFKYADKVNKFEVRIHDECKEFEIEIKQELGAVCKDDSIQKTGILKVEPKLIIKEKLGHSPDFADMKMMRSFFDLVETEKVRVVSVY